MSLDRTVGHRRARRRAFQPTLDGGLESRFLLSNLPGRFFLKNPKPGVAFINNNPKFRDGTTAHPFPVAKFPRGVQIATQTARGGQSVIIATPDGSAFIVSVTQFVPTPGGSQGASPNEQPPIQGQIPGTASPVQPLGTVRAYPMSGGRVGIIVDGSTNQTELTISPYPKYQRKGYAHSFSYGQTNQAHLLNVGQLTINSGVISAINGYHTTDLSGPLVVAGTEPVDRISLNSMQPGAAIQTGGDLNTLDVLEGINLDRGPGITVGRDLNLFNVGQDVNLSNGASIRVGRFLGLVPQPAKGTATGGNFLAINQALVGTGTSTIVPSLSAYLQGTVNIGPGSVFSVTQGIPNTSLLGNVQTSAPSVFLINGSLITSSGTFDQLQIPGLNNLNTGTTLINGILASIPPPNTIFQVNSVIARTGSNINGFGP
jgi:hypothetical protein